MQSLKHKFLYAILSIVAVLFLLGSPVALADNDPCHPEANNSGLAPLTATQLKSCKACQGSNSTGCLKDNVIITDLNLIIDFLSAGVGIVVVGSLIFGGIQYSMAGGSPEAVNKAKQRITNAIIALVAFLFIFAFLQWILPGGI